MQPVHVESTSNTDTHAAAFTTAAGPSYLSDDDDDEDLRVELAFTKKPKTSAVQPTASPTVAKLDSAAHDSPLGHDPFARISQPYSWSLPQTSTRGADDNEIYDVPDDEPCTGTNKAK